VESRKLTLKQKGRPAKSVEGHEAVVAAMRRRTLNGAAKAMYEHIDQIAPSATACQRVSGDSEK